MTIHPEIAKRVLEVSGDPNEKICLSASVAKVLVERSPLHAWCKHRLLGGFKADRTAATDDGQIYEALIFGQQDQKIQLVDASDWRTNAAKDARASIERQGLIAMLAPKYAEYAHVAGAIKGGMQKAGFIFNGAIQQKLLWEHSGVNCKAYLDQFVRTEGRIDDLKCVADASPAAVANHMVKYGYDIQEAAYTEAAETLYPDLLGRVKFTFWFAEKDAPFAVQPYTTTGMMKELGKRKWAFAKAVWLGCIAGNVWPGYGAGVLQVEAKPWHLQAQEDRELGGSHE